jgi:hypothetical protein
MKRIRKRMTFANVVSCIALFVALGGASYAATQLPKNSVGSKQLKKNAVTAAKIKNGAVTGAKIKTSSLGTVPNASSLGGLPASSYAIRSAVILGDGKIFSNQADGIAQSNITLANPGLICISGLNPAPKTAVASLAFESFDDWVFVAVNPSEGPCAGKQVAIATESEVGFRADPVAVIIH